jgi:AraC-like DNA-binding protein
MSGGRTRHFDEVMAVVSGSAAPSTGRVVQASWVRSATAHRVDPNSREPPRIVTFSELRDSRDAEAALIEVAQVELDRLYRVVRPTRYVILLCDRNGLVIEHRGEEADAEQFRRWGTWLGGIWSEDVEGTNGIGTCLAEGRPVTVHRSQHFRTRHISLSCSGAPIFDPDGELLGVLDVSSIDPQLSDHAHALTGSLTIAAARAIEERLFRKRFHRSWIVATRPPDAPAGGMLIAVDRDLQVVGADRYARRAPSPLGQEQPAGLGLWAVFERDDRLFRRATRGDSWVELTPKGGADSWPAIVTPPTPPASSSLAEELMLSSRLDALALRRGEPEPARGGLPPATLNRLRGFIDANLGANIDLGSLATNAELSLFHFARAFKQSEGVTPHRYILERRVAKARELLTGSREPLAQIALATGFADQSHFARRFREVVGLSPGEYRKQEA